jgi:Holliday junction resolvasome RuvABC endonuclease subunit
LRILAIDEGTRRVGIAVLDLNGDIHTLVGAFLFRMDIKPYKDWDISSRLFALFSEVQQYILRYAPDLVATEHVRVSFGGKNKDATLITARAQCAVVLAAKTIGKPTVEIMANQVRSSLGIKGKLTSEAAKLKTQELVNSMFEARIREFNHGELLGPKMTDVSDAIGLALVAPAYINRDCNS